MTLANTIPPALANHLWQSTLFTVAAALLALALRKNRAQTRYWVWLIASMKFLIPFSLLVGIGSHLEWSVPAPIAHRTLPVAVQQIGQPFAAAVVSSIERPILPISTSPMVKMMVSIWLCGVITVLISWLRSWLRVHAAVLAAKPLPLETPIPALSSPSRIEPGVFGIFRPVLLLPEGIIGRFSPAHMEAIVAHELCHVRRRDNLAASLHMLVEALFWFHPLVWWIGGRLVEERERACDEEVLRLGSQPRVYAESILKTCQFYLESPVACVCGVTGSDLKKRVVRIMSQGIAARLTIRKKLLLATAAAAAVVLPLIIGLLNASQGRAQSQPVGNASPSFEVASIKPTKSGSQGVRISLRPGSRFEADGITAKLLLEEAYNIKDAQISQAPPWVDSERYDIDAKPDESTAAAMEKLPPDQRMDMMRQMMRSLLADRFKLTLGHDTKELPVYALVVAKNGPKLHESAYKPPAKLPDSPPTPGQGGGPPPGQGIWITGRGRITVTDSDLSMFANVLSRGIVGRVVLDKTGLSGHYDFTLQWTPEEGEGPSFPGGPPPGAPGQGAGGTPPPESSGPSLFTALQEQLGLKLESQKAPMDVLVIEHVEKPSEN